MRQRTVLILFAAAVSVTACAYYDDYTHRADVPVYGGYSYAGDAYADEESVGMGFAGEGASLLDPWLATTHEGRKAVMLGFARKDAGRLSPETARRANGWFRRYADTNRDMRLTDEEIRVALVQASRG